VYVVRWRRGPGVGSVDWAAIGLDALLFSVFAAHHSVFARTGAKTVLSRAVPERLLRSAYVWIASVLFLMVMASWRPVGGLLYEASGLAAVLLTGTQVSGLVLTAWSVRAIDALDLAGIRQGPERQSLQARGPYLLVRHPLYLAWVLMVFGAARMTGDRAVFAIVSSLYLVLAIPWEERSLRASFGDAYGRYAERVRWRIVPGVY
jgi:protein-S-isoprenylcysteine O-methyltransferase Ste14